MEPLQPQEIPRRTFLKWCTHGLGALFTVVLGAPVVAYLFDPLHRAKSAGGFRTVDGIRLSELKVGQPKQGVIRNVRRDAWTLYPNDVVGRVWVVKRQDFTVPDAGLQRLGRDLAEADVKIEEAKKIADPAQRDEKLKPLLEQEARLASQAQAKVGVFTTVCPHLGCSINVTPAGFACPCHGGKFDLQGSLVDKESNPAPRGMDSLVWMVSPQDPDVMQVKYVNYKQTLPEKIERA